MTCRSQNAQQSLLHGVTFELILLKRLNVKKFQVYLTIFKAYFKY